MAKPSVIYFVPAMIWSICILILSTIHPSSINQFSWSDIANIDKLGHFLFYAILSFLLALGFYKYGLNKFDNYKLFITMAISIGYGAGIEILQYALIEGRYFDFLDLLANIIGCLSGIVIFMFLKRNKVWIFH